MSGKNPCCCRLRNKLPCDERVGHDVDYSSRSAAKFGDAAGNDDLKFADHFLAEKCAWQIGGIIVGREAVNDETVIDVALTGDVDLRSRHGGSFGEALIGDRIGTRDGGRERGKIKVVAPVERETLNLAREHSLSRLRARGLNHWCFGGDVNSFDDSSDA